MPNTPEDRRTSGRRREPRRISDFLRGVVPEEELQKYEKQQYGRSIGVDRRIRERRSGEDRRGENSE